LKIDAGLSLLPFASTLTVEGKGLDWLFHTKVFAKWSVERIVGCVLFHVLALAGAAIRGIYMDLEDHGLELFIRACSNSIMYGSEKHRMTI